jgi:hypothetical protein
MKAEKKLIAFSVLSLIVGIACIVPVAVLMSVSGAAKAETTVEPWFNLNLPYAYLTANSTTFPNGTFSYGAWHALIPNSTINIDTAAGSTADAQIDYFQIQIYSDTGPIENITSHFGTNRTSDFDFSPYSFMVNDWFGSNISRGGGAFWFGPASDYNSNYPLAVQSGSSSGRGPLELNNITYNAPQRVLNIENAQTVYIDVRRLGSVTFNGNSSVITLANGEVLQHIELQKFREGFLYNNYFPADQMSQIDPNAPPVGNLFPEP